MTTMQMQMQMQMMDDDDDDDDEDDDDDDDQSPKVVVDSQQMDMRRSLSWLQFVHFHPEIRFTWRDKHQQAADENRG
jgi:hypothetical protein